MRGEGANRLINCSPPSESLSFAIFIDSFTRQNQREAFFMLFPRKAIWNLITSFHFVSSAFFCADSREEKNCRNKVLGVWGQILHLHSLSLGFFPISTWYRFMFNSCSSALASAFYHLLSLTLSFFLNILKSIWTQQTIISLKIPGHFLTALFAGCSLVNKVIGQPCHHPILHVKKWGTKGPTRTV